MTSFFTMINKRTLSTATLLGLIAEGAEGRALWPDFHEALESVIRDSFSRQIAPLPPQILAESVAMVRKCRTAQFGTEAGKAFVMPILHLRRSAVTCITPHMIQCQAHSFSSVFDHTHNTAGPCLPTLMQDLDLLKDDVNGRRATELGKVFSIIVWPTQLPVELAGIAESGEPHAIKTCQDMREYATKDAKGWPSVMVKRCRTCITVMSFTQASHSSQIWTSGPLGAPTRLRMAWCQCCHVPGSSTLQV